MSELKEYFNGNPIDSEFISRERIREAIRYVDEELNPDSKVYCDFARELISELGL